MTLMMSDTFVAFRKHQICNAMKKCLFLLLFLGSLVYAADPITVVQYPLTTRPAVLKAGETLSVLCKAPASASGWTAQISTPYNSVSLTPAAVYNSATGVWTLSSVIPADTPFELYDLKVTASGGISDDVVHAVKILSEYRDTYYFAHVADLHMPSVAWQGYIDYEDKNSAAEFIQILQELSVINPEFVLQTGDIVDNGLQEDQFQICQEIFNDAKVPIFATAGNHDVWHDGHTYWNRYFNPVMNYSFNYGEHHFSGMEMYLVPTVTFTAQQMQWLQDDLYQSVQRNDKMRMLFYHYDESEQINGDFCDDFEVDLTVFGHTHENAVFTNGSRPTIHLNTAATMNDQGNYRIIKVSNDRVQQYPLMKFKKLTTTFLSANDGSNWTNKATIVNNNNVSFENGLIKFLMQKQSAGYNVTGGTVEQVIHASDMDVYYVSVNIRANSTQNVEIVSVTPLSNHPPQITDYSPDENPAVYAGEAFSFRITATDPDNDAMQYEWFQDDMLISGSTNAVLNFTADVDFRGETVIRGRVSDGEYYAEHQWIADVQKPSDGPEVKITSYNFFLQNEPMTIEWTEPKPINAYLEFGLTPGEYTGKVYETSDGQTTFTPELVGMEIGVNYCRISDGAVSSDVFSVIIESPQAPEMLTPIGDIQTLTPIFSWGQVPGVPYYVVICSDEEIIISTDPVTGEYSVEGANAIWATITYENSVSYGTKDPSGTFTNAPAPMAPGQSYWWVVLNCYGDSPELTSPVNSGISKFTIDLPLPDIDAPELISPAVNDTLSDEVITFSWKPVDDATAYHFYPFKIEEEADIETARGLWQDIIATTESQYNYPAKDLLVEGRYRWKVAAVADNGLEMASELRNFYYKASSATLNIRTYDDNNTPTAFGDDVALPRVNIAYKALQGVYTAMPLSTDLDGKRINYLVSPGIYQFTIEKDGYNTIIDTLTFVENQTYSLSFRLSSSPCTVTGRIVDQFEEGVGNANVTAEHTLRTDVLKSTMTDTRGYFSLPLLAGPYRLLISKEGYTSPDPHSFSIESDEIKAISPDLVLTKNANIITGTVVNTAQQPVYGVLVRLANDASEVSQRTNADGFFSFEVQNGTWTVSVEKDGFVSPASRQVTVTGNSNISLTPPFILQSNAAIIQGQVTDGLSPLAGVVVKAIPSAGTAFQTTTDDFGQFTLNVTSGTFTLYAEKSGYIFNQSIQATLSSGETLSGQKIVLSPAQSFVKGKVTTDGYTPLQGVKISNSGVSVLTNESGTYSLGVEPGTHSISAAKEGYISTSPDTVTVAPGQVVENINFILSPNASVIKGRVTFNGSGINHAQVNAVNSHTVTTFSDENGYYVLNVDAGEWQITVSKENYTTESKTGIVIGTAQTLLDVDFELSLNSGVVSGVVRSTNSSAAIAGVKVTVWENGFSTLTNQQGRFSFSFTPGEYHLNFEKTGFQSVQNKTVTVTVNQTSELTIDLQPMESQFNGTVLTQDDLPLKNVQILAVSGTDTTTTLTTTDGKFVLGVHAGTYQLTAVKSGYQDYTWPQNYSIANGETIQLPNAKLTSAFIKVAGNVRDVSSTGIAEARITAKTTTGFSAQTQTSETGEFEFVDTSGQPILPAGTYTLIALKNGYQPDTLSNVNINSPVTDLAFQLIKNTGAVKGIVYLDNVALAGATVTAVASTSKKSFSTVSQTNGRFEISGLVSGTYKVKAVFTGASVPEEQVIDASSGTDVGIYLTSNKGHLYGTIKNAAFNTVINQASITLNNNHGGVNTVYSDSTGFYQAKSLPTDYPFNIKIVKKGYQTIEQNSVVIDSSTQLDYNLEPLYGDISGNVSQDGNTPVDEVIVHAVSQRYSFSDTTDQNGTYQFINIPADLYTVSAEKVGYRSDPIEKSADLWLGGDLTNYNFTFIEAIAAKLTIIGPENVKNTVVQKYNFTAKTADNREAVIDPLWSVNFTPAVELLDQNGILDPANDYIGSVIITITDQFSGAFASQKVYIYQEVTDKTHQKELTDKRNIQLYLPDNSAEQKIQLQLRKPDFSDIRRNKKDYQVIGDIYQLSPTTYVFSSPLELVFSVPEEYLDKKVVIGKWNTDRLEWEVITSEKIGDEQLRVSTHQLGRFAMLAQAEPLSISDIKILPNPFSPYTGPAKISYTITSNTTTTPIVTAKVYNMVGDLVKILIDAKPQERGENLVEWDGLSDMGRMAMNGRYLLRMQVKDMTGTKEKLETFVLIK